MVSERLRIHTACMEAIITYSRREKRRNPSVRAEIRTGNPQKTSLQYFCYAKYFSAMNASTTLSKFRVPHQNSMGKLVRAISQLHFEGCIIRLRSETSRSRLHSI
jgi:hypothetical protein